MITSKQLFIDSILLPPCPCNQLSTNISAAMERRLQQTKKERRNWVIRCAGVGVGGHGMMFVYGNMQPIKIRPCGMEHLSCRQSE